MSTPAIPLINGNRYSFVSMELRISQLGNKRYVGCKAYNYEDKLDPGKVKGTASQKIGRTNGDADATGSLEVYLQEFDDFAQGLVQQAVAAGYPVGIGLMQISFDIISAYNEAFSPVITDTCYGNRITNIQKNRQQGSDALSVTMPLDIMRIDHNGVPGVMLIQNLGT